MRRLEVVINGVLRVLDVPQRTGYSVDRGASVRKRSDKELYLLKLTVKDIEPPIWRRLLVRSDTTLARLHLIIQSLMEWENYHLYQFQILDKTHGPPAVDDEEYGRRESVRLRLSTVFRDGVDTIVYEYDFGDGWEIIVELEDLLPANEQEENVKCIGGARRGPLEDSGGPLGYMEKLQIRKDPTHPDHKEVKDWIGPRFDPEAFNLYEANYNLREF